MTMYNTYAAAKIANPECEIYNDIKGKFKAIKDEPTSHFANGWKLCNPADHCKTLGWLRNNHGAEFAGDIIIGHCSGKVIEITQDKIKDYDDSCLILRAAALEGKPNQYESVAKDLPKKRVEVGYERINVNNEGEKYWEIAREWSESYHSNIHYSHDGSFLAVTSNQILLDEYCGGNLFRRIETEIDERQEFIESVKAIGITFFDGSKLTNSNIDHLAKEIYDSGKFKLVDGE